MTDLEARVARLEEENAHIRATLTLATDWIMEATETIRVLAIEVDSPNLIIPGR